jgi:hypothetical protein
MINNELVSRLIEVDFEDDLLELLKEFGYWDDEDVWRHVGDNPNNFHLVGGSNARPGPALVEKITNSVDAVLIGECFKRGIHPESPDAPQTSREAVARFIEGVEGDLCEKDGLPIHWHETLNWAPGGKAFLDIARRVNLVITGTKAQTTTVTVVDDGIGQSPDHFPTTFFKLGNSNKIKIPFAQGRYGKGGAGVSYFCSPNHRFQILISRRDPEVLRKSGEVSDSDPNWGFTVVRQKYSEGDPNSAWEYLAPVDAKVKPKKGGVLTSDLPKLPIFPIDGKKFDEGLSKNVFIQEISHGTFVKMVEYELDKASDQGQPGSNGLLPNLRVRLPRVPIPFRIGETRYGSSSGGFHNMSGCLYRVLHEERKNPGKVLELQIKTNIHVNGTEIPVEVILLKEGVKRSNFFYKEVGVVFTEGPQTQEELKTAFFTRTAVNLHNLKNFLFVLVDLTDLHPQIKEALFMPDREKFRQNNTRADLITALETFLKNHRSLREESQRRKRESVRDSFDAKNTRELMLRLIKSNPALKEIFNSGADIKTPFDDSGSEAGGKGKFKGSISPSFFHFFKKGLQNDRNIYVGQNSRLDFETDAEDSYFDRSQSQGKVTVQEVNNMPFSGSWGSLEDGAITYTLNSVDERRVGETLRLKFVVHDELMVQDLPECEAILHVAPLRKDSHGGTGGKRKTANKETGIKGDQLNLADLSFVKKSHVEGKENFEENWDEYTSMTIGLDDGIIDTFSWNEDNKYLKHWQKQEASSVNGDLAEVTAERFKLGLAFLAIAYANELEKMKSKSEDPDVIDVAERVEDFTRSAALPLIPVIKALAASDLEEQFGDEDAGEE